MRVFGASALPDEQEAILPLVRMPGSRHDDLVWWATADLSLIYYNKNKGNKGKKRSTL